jgi:hypothetical protein
MLEGIGERNRGQDASPSQGSIAQRPGTVAYKAAYIRRGQEMSEGSENHRKQAWI